MARRQITAATLAAATLPLLVPAAASAGTGTDLLNRPASDPFAPLLVNDSVVGMNAISDDGCKTVFVSDSDGLLSTDVDTGANVYVRDSCASPNTLVQVNRTQADTPGTPARRGTFRPSISGNGTVVVFTAGDEVLDPGGNERPVTFAKSLTTGALEIRSRKVDGSVAIVENGSAAAVNTAGTAVTFVTAENALQTSADANGSRDLYVRGLTTDLLSRNTGAAGTAVGGVREGGISANGQVAVWVTEAAVTTANAVTNTAGNDVYVRDGSTTEVVSVGDGSTTSTGAVPEAFRPDLTTTGDVVGFATSAPTASAGGLTDANGQVDAFVRHRGGAPTTRLLSHRDGQTTAVGSAADQVDLSGATAAFRSASRITADDSDFRDDVFVRPFTGDPATLASREDGSAPSVDDGQFATFASGAAGNAVAFGGRSTTAGPALDTETAQVQLRRLSEFDTLPVSSPPGPGPFSNGGRAGLDFTDGSAIDRTGRRVLFSSTDDGLLPLGSTTQETQLFVRDIRTDDARWVSGPDLDGSPYRATEGSIAAGGRFVVFATAGRLVEGETGGGTDLYRRDLQTDALRVLTDRDPADPPTEGIDDPSPSDSSNFFAPSVSGDGRRVAFLTEAALDPGDADGAVDAYVSDLGADPVTAELVSRATGSAGATGSAFVSEPVISSDGSAVAFSTDASLDPADPGDTDVYVREVDADTTEWVSRSGGSGPATVSGGFDPSVDATGARVAFASEQPLTGEPLLGQVFVRDLEVDATTLVSRPTGTTTLPDGGSEQPSISEDGRRVAFRSTARNFDPPPTAPSPVFVANVWVRDLQTATTTLASRTDAGDQAVVDAQAPALSGNGQCVAFRASGGGLTASAPPHSDSLLLYARALAGGECADESAPVDATQITAGPSGTITTASTSFAFTHPEAGVGFSCVVDGGAPADCTSPVALDGLGEGPHTFSVRAVDAEGNAEAVAVERSFRVDLPDAPPGGGGTSGAGGGGGASGGTGTSGSGGGTGGSGGGTAGSGGGTAGTGLLRAGGIPRLPRTATARRGVVSLTLTCPAGRSCSGTVRLRRGRQSLGTRRFDGSGRLTARLSLNRAGKAVLRRKGRRVRLAVVLTPRGAKARKPSALTVTVR